jgi:hypothetical protein
MKSMIYKVKMLFRTVEFHSILSMIKNVKASKILIETETNFLNQYPNQLKATKFLNESKGSQNVE